jgi:hypothetical protein
LAAFLGDLCGKELYRKGRKETRKVRKEKQL